MPRILSPAYFHHYNAQPSSVSADVHGEEVEKSRAEKLKENGGEQLVIGLGPVQRSFWRLSKLVPLSGFRSHFNRYRGRKIDPVDSSTVTDSALTSSIEDITDEPQSLEIREGSDGISLKPLSDPKTQSLDATSEKLVEKNNSDTEEGRKWRRVPSLPLYVPFGQVRH